MPEENSAKKRGWQLLVIVLSCLMILQLWQQYGHAGEAFNSALAQSIQQEDIDIHARFGTITPDNAGDETSEMASVSDDSH